MKISFAVYLLAAAFLCQSAHATCKPTKKYNVPLDSVIEDIRIGDLKRRQKAVTILAETCNENAIVPLLQILQDKDADAAGAAALALGAMQEDSALVPLADALLVKDARADGAARALGQLKLTTPVPRMVKQLAECKRYQTRAAIALALGDINDPRAKKFVLKAANNDASIDVRAEALRASGKMKDDKAYPLFVKYLASKHLSLRLAATEALGYLENTSAMEVLEVALQDEAPQVRKAAADSLGKLMLEESLPALEHAMKDKNLEVKKAAAEAYDKIFTAVEESKKQETENAMGD